MVLVLTLSLIVACVWTFDVTQKTNVWGLGEGSVCKVPTKEEWILEFGSVAHTWKPNVIISVIIVLGGWRQEDPQNLLASQSSLCQVLSSIKDAVSKDKV